MLNSGIIQEKMVKKQQEIVKIQQQMIGNRVALNTKRMRINTAQKYMLILAMMSPAAWQLRKLSSNPVRKTGGGGLHCTNTHGTEIQDDSPSSDNAETEVDHVVAPVNNRSSTSTQRPITRLQHGIRKPKQYSDGTIKYNGKFGLLAHVGEPQNLEETLKNEHWKMLWI
jgi:hypothetical protein